MKKELLSFLYNVNSKDFTKVLTSAIIGTSAMTLYSYLRSDSYENDYREPHLLNIMIDRLNVGIEKPSIAGWILHYKVGFGFATAYHAYWSKKSQASVISGSTLGAISGLFGILAWDTTMKNHPNPPAIDRKSFYQHLFIAHMVFGTFAALGYKLVENTIVSGNKPQ